MNVLHQRVRISTNEQGIHATKLGCLRKVSLSLGTRSDSQKPLLLLSWDSTRKAGLHYWQSVADSKRSKALRGARSGFECFIVYYK